jgi:NAD-dependent histone deacetylase SIR2
VDLKSNVIGNCSPTPTHWFLRLLDVKKKLLRLYTQNIDGLESQTGMAEVKIFEKSEKPGGVVFLHGNINRLRCERCGFKSRWNHTDIGGSDGRSVIACPQCQKRGELLTVKLGVVLP